MFKKLAQRHSADANKAKIAAESDDDDISVTSSVEALQDPDQEYDVEDILAEQTNEEGDCFFLVSWAGFPLHEATWEPLENINDVLRAQWEDKKRRIAAGEQEPFQVSDYTDAVEREKKRREERKVERHRRRNQKRKRLGLPLTKPYPESDSSDEAEEVGDEYVAGNDPGTKRKLRSTQKPTSTTLPKPSTSNRKPDAVPAQANGPKDQGQTRHTSLTKPPTTTTAVPPGRPVTTSVSGPSRIQVERASATGYQGTARSSAARPPSGNPRVPPSSTTNRSGSASNPVAKSKVMLKRSGAKGPVGNIFTSGKVQKPRASLREVYADPTKAGSSTHLGNRWSNLRRLELASRRKEDLPPDADALVLFEPSSAGLRNGSMGSTKDVSQASPTSIVSPTSNVSPLVADPTQIQPEAGTMLVPEPVPGVLKNPNNPGAVKRRKSVRFAGDGRSMQGSDAMDIDMPDPPASQRPRLRSPPAPDRNDIQSVKKDLLLLGGRKIKDVQFGGLPTGPGHKWVQHFVAEKTFDFRLSCLAQNAANQLGQLVDTVAGILATGTVTSEAGGDQTDELAEFLKSSLLGLFYPHPEFNLLVFPAKCEEWRLDFLGQWPESSAALRFLVFASNVDYRNILPPEAVGNAESPCLPKESEKGLPSESATSIMSPREAVFKRLFNFDYKRLLPLPTHRKATASDIFFLVFPEKRRDAMDAVASWLRACNPACQIFISCNRGSWKAFRAAVNREPGVIIVHDILIPTFRLFPGLGRYLVEKYDEYWCFLEPTQPQPYPSPTLVDDPSPFSCIQLNRFFGLRTAVLLTPSFLIFQPQQLDKLLRWLEGKDPRGAYYRLVTVWNFHEYLAELASKKYDTRHDSISDQKARESAANIALSLYFQRLDKAGLYDVNEEDSRLIYADRCIDPNDEQSLVNWFGWWSTMRISQFRKFYVVGTDESVLAHSRCEVRIRIPNYSRVTINDPDIVREAFQQSLTESVGHGPVQASGASDSGIPGYATGPQPFASDLIPSDQPKHINASIKDVFLNSPKNMLRTLYGFVVSWDSWDMACHFGDSDTDYKTIGDWFRFTWPFLPTNPPNPRNKAFNTYIGVFYTITTDWDPAKIPRDLHRVPRHPWIAIYRAAYPIQTPLRECEIIIWDAHAKDRCPGNRDPSYDDLLWMQRRVVDYLIQHGPSTNPNTVIKQVWLGGFEINPKVQSVHPMDTTLRFLSSVLSEDFKTELPMPEHFMRQKHYKRVRMPGDPAPLRTQRPMDATKDVALPIGSPSEDESETDGDEDTRIIFHPPRGAKLARGQQTKCKNKLYEDARLIRANRAGEEFMTFQFTPTLTWYNDQAAEGRGFEFINVESWTDINRDLGIEKAQDPRNIKAAQESPGSGTKECNESVTSG